MHPLRNIGRRRARVVAILRRAAEVPGGSCFVDDAQCENSNKYAVVLVDQAGSVITAALTECSSSSASGSVAIVNAFLSVPSVGSATPQRRLARQPPTAPRKPNMCLCRAVGQIVFVKHVSGENAP
ncbi:hypothetical protein MRX96_007525 [Rhipicephalus microplus]